MPLVGIREANIDERWSPSDDIGDIEIKFDRGSFVDTESLVKFEFEYTPSNGFGVVQGVTGQIQIHRNSNLVFVISEGNKENVEQVFRELRRSADEQLNVNHRFVIERGKIWNFISYGSIQRVDVVTPFGGVQRVSLEESTTGSGITIEEARMDYPVDYAVIEFENDRLFDVKYDEDLLSIESSESDDVDFVIQTFASAITE